MDFQNVSNDSIPMHWSLPSLTLIMIEWLKRTLSCGDASMKEIQIRKFIRLVSRKLSNYALIPLAFAVHTIKIKIHRYFLFAFSDPPRKENIRTMSALSLYTEKDRKGRKLFIDGLEVRLPKVANFSSFTGYGTWQTFTGRDFDGNTTCLTKFTNSNFQGVDDDDVLQVGSIKLGCGHPINEFEDYEDDDVSSAPVYKSSSVILLTYAMALIIFK